MADSPTQVREIAAARERIDAWCEYIAGAKQPTNRVLALAVDLRTLIAAYTRMEADLAGVIERAAKIADDATPHHFHHEVAAGIRALATFHNKGEE